jgi:hypothetical protein
MKATGEPAPKNDLLGRRAGAPGQHGECDLPRHARSRYRCDSIEASYFHLPFCMAVTTGELERGQLKLRESCSMGWRPCPNRAIASRFRSSSP